MTPAISAIIAFYRNQTDTSPIGYLNYTASGSNQYYITMTTVSNVLRSRSRSESLRGELVAD